MRKSRANPKNSSFIHIISKSIHCLRSIFLVFLALPLISFSHEQYIESLSPVLITDISSIENENYEELINADIIFVHEITSVACIDYLDRILPQEFRYLHAPYPFAPDHISDQMGIVSKHRVKLRNFSVTQRGEMQISRYEFVLFKENNEQLTITMTVKDLGAFRTVPPVKRHKKKSNHTSYLLCKSTESDEKRSSGNVTARVEAESNSKEDTARFSIDASRNNGKGLSVSVHAEANVTNPKGGSPNVGAKASGEVKFDFHHDMDGYYHDNSGRLIDMDGMFSPEPTHSDLNL